MEKTRITIICIVLSLLLAIPTAIAGPERCGVKDATLEELLIIQQNNELLRGGQEIFEMPNEINIPIAFHVVTNEDGTEGNLSETDINNQIVVLNNAYSQYGINFWLHSADTINDDNFYYHVLELFYESQLKAQYAADPEHTLNIYTVGVLQEPGETFEYFGISTFPWDYNQSHHMNGVMLKYTTLPGGTETGYNEGDTGTHEVGHYLGLWHTFQLGCASPGDEVGDTPKQADGPNKWDCTDSLNTCVDFPVDFTDPVHNFMNYTDDACINEFTQGQKDRMFDQIEIHKSGLYHIDITLTNSEIGVSGSNLGGQLSLDQLDGDEDYPGEQSGNEVAVIVGYDYTAWTHNKTLIGSQGAVEHYDWFPISNIKTINENMEIETGQSSIRALFKDVAEIQISSVVPEALEFHDPWYIQHIEDDPGIWDQPDELRPLPELTVNGDYEVFLNQNPNFNPGDDIYSLNAPQSYVDLNGIYEFVNWTGVDIAFNIAGDNSTSNNETPIVFLTNNASVTANYEILNLIPNNQINVEVGEQLIIPAGANIPFAEGVQIEMHGGDLIVQGTYEDPIRLYPETNSWNGIVETLANSSVIIDHATLEGANDQIQGGSSLYFYSSSLMISNSTFLNCGAITTFDDIDLSRNVFISDGVTESPALDIRNVSRATITNNTFINHKNSIKGGQAQIYNDEFQMFNNIFYFNSTLHNNANTAPFVQDPSFPSPVNEPMYIDYNLFYGYEQNGLYPIPYLYWMNSQFGNPEFADETNDNFYLTPFSNSVIDLGRPEPQYNDPDGSRGDLGAYPLSLLGGIQATDITMQGSAWITADYTVASGANLSILPGTELFFAENKKITIEGSLTALGV
ncbi:MAG: zinc metalloprotease [FCB group bacterium]|nr:zinc metalloprotease [FCB group bacterium]MBL7027745.1 zinc metalloprotease [Candidatus Neomarinimicrobiota bacterium]MBL7121008.1 zinc metalloprotease [Candidatus Neomarinimicrobiota bacterium]